MHHLRNWQEKEKEEARIRGASAGFGVNVDGYHGGDGENVDANAMGQIPSHIKTPPKKGGERRGFSSVAMDEENGALSPTGSPQKKTIDRRREILINSGSAPPSSAFVAVDGGKGDDHASVGMEESLSNETMKTMADVISAIKLNMSSSRRSNAEQSNLMQYEASVNSDVLNVHSTIHYNTAKVSVMCPSLRVSKEWIMKNCNNHSTVSPFYHDNE